MCRLLGYLGQPILLQPLLEGTEHSLVIQSYQPQEMTSGLMNADGYGIGWYDRQKQTEPFTYKNILPIWNDVNFPHLSRYIQSNCVLANVRSASPGISTDLSNCQPFCSGSIMGVHNGLIKDFRRSLYRIIRNQLDDEYYQSINGNTDSEHIFALVMQFLQLPEMTLALALQKACNMLLSWANEQEVAISLNIILTDGQQIVASRCAGGTAVPSLYWLKDSPQFPTSALIASEPLFASDDWTSLPENSILEILPDFSTRFYEVPLALALLV